MGAAAASAPIMGADKHASVVGANSVDLVPLDIQPFKDFVGEPVSVDIEPVRDVLFRVLAAIGMLCSTIQWPSLSV